MIEEITKEKVNELSVSSLPTRPTAPTSSGGAGFSAKEMKNAFDALTLHVIEKFNELIRAIKDTGEGSLLSEIPSGLSDGHTLLDMLEDITSGDFVSYVNVRGKSLATRISEMESTLETVKERLRI